jgi:hypothetical protein
MSITVTKQKAAKKKEKPELVDPADLQEEQLADEYGRLEDAVNALLMNPLFTQFEEVKKALSHRLQAHYHPASTVTIKGEHYLLDIGKAARAPAEIVNMSQLRTFMGEDAFMKVVKVNLSDVKAYCTPEQLAKVLNEETGYTTRRKITAKYLGT